MENNDQVTQIEETAPVRDVSYPQINNQPEDNNGGNLKWIILIVLVLVGLGVLGWFIFSKSSSVEEATPMPEEIQETIAPVETASPSPSASPAAVDKSKVKIKVDNGTGISGEAAYLQNQLKALGYTQVTTGNAAENVTKTSVSFSATLAQSVIDEITTKLRSIYAQVEVKTTTSSTVDVEIVVGLRKGATTKPSSTPTASPTAGATSTSTPTSSPTATP